MTTGASIYLVSACGSGEEFVAAFRRYADRNGLFVPMADPIAAGRRGRFAVALRDGGVMIEGEAEVVASARTPSVLHGRVGMTLRFVDPDERSRVVLVELERARLSMKPAPPSVAPRPAELPPSPRPVPPAPGGRIDAANALAECVAIGDLDALATSGGAAAPPKAGPKFVVPTVPPVAGKAPAAGSAAPPRAPTADDAWDLDEGDDAPVRPTEVALPAPLLEGLTAAHPAPPPPAMPPAGVVTQAPRRTDPTFAIPPGPQSEPTIPAQPGPPSSPAIPVPAVPVQTAANLAPPPPSSKSGDGGAKRPTAATPPVAIPRTITPLPGMPPISTPPGMGRSTASLPPLASPPPATRRDSAPLVAPLPPPARRDSAPLVAPAPPPETRRDSGQLLAPPLPAEPRRDSLTEISPPPQARRDSGQLIAPAPPETRRDSAPLVAPPPPATRRDSAPLIAPPPPETRRSSPRVAVEEPVQRPSATGIEAAPLPPPPAAATPPVEDSLTDIEIDEPTDLTTVPVESAAEPARKAEAPAPSPRPPVIGVPPEAPPRPPNVEEPTPSGDWTMVPGADGPTIQPRMTPPPRPRPESNPPGDWSIAVDPQAADGWRDSSKILTGPPAAAPPPPAAPAGPPPVPAPQSRRRSDPMPVVTSTHPLESEPSHPVAELRGVAEPKVQVDPTLIEPLAAQPQVEGPSVRSNGSQPVMEPPMAASSSTGMRLQHLMTPLPGFMPPYAAPPAIPGQGAGPFAPPVDPIQASVPVTDDRNDATVRVRVPSGPPSPGAAARRKRMIVIAASATLALGAAIVLIAVAGSGEARSEAPPELAVTPPPSPDAAAAAPSADAAVLAADRTEPVKTPAEPEAPDAGSAAAGRCTFDVASTPTGAEVLLDNDVIATTPAKLTYACDVELKLLFKKARFVTAERKYTPAENGKPLKVTLVKPAVLIKVSSTPSGAAVSVGGKPQGVTPTTIRIPINETSTLTFSKEGFATETQRITPKQNNQTVNATLKRLPRKVPR